MDKIKYHLLEIAPKIFRDHPVAFAYLYGSYSHGIVHPFSDLDICIYTDNISLREKLNLQMIIALQIDERMGIKIDSEVRIMNDMPLIIKGQVVTEGILIYSRDNELLVDVETSIRKAYFDFLPAIREYQQAFINSHSHLL
jgi:predicted nucleotidyltransferase